MKKEEFLAFSLKKGLKCKHKIATGYNNSVPGITTINYEDKIDKITGIEKAHVLFNYTRGTTFKNCFPICHPLSDLTKPIEHNGETFVPIVYLAKMRSAYLHESDFDRYYGKLKMDISTQRLPFDMFQKLVEWKFDIAGLIEKGEAIDINTLPENPYK